MKAKIASVIFMTFSFTSLPAYADNLIEPEIVRLESVSVGNTQKVIMVGNNNGHYVLKCTIGADNGDDPKYKDMPITKCATPKPNTDYWVYNNETKWMLPNAKVPTTLQFFKDFSVDYKGESIALIPTDNKSDWGMYSLKSWIK